MARLRLILRDPVWVDAILPTILIRGVILAFAPLVVAVFAPQAIPQSSLLEIWRRWDVPRLLEIAQGGYGPPTDPTAITLFPFFPLLVAAGSRLGDPLVIGMVISFAATLAAAAGLYRLVRMDGDRRTARLAVVAMNVFPTAFTFVAAYTEATFLALTVWAFVLARRSDWRGAGILALLAGATRIHGAFLLPALAVEYWLSRRRLGRDALWILLAAGGPLIYLAINQATFGDPLHFVEVQREHFFVTTVPPWEPISGLVASVLRPEATEGWITLSVAPLVAFIILAGATLWTVIGKGTRPSYAVYTGLTLFSLASLSFPLSVPRYVGVVFPVFMATARLARRPWLGPPLLVASTLLLSVFLTLFVIGHWAF